MELVVKTASADRTPAFPLLRNFVSRTVEIQGCDVA